MSKNFNTAITLLFIASAIVSCERGAAPVKQSNGVAKVSYFAKASGTGMKTAAAKSESTFAETVVVNWSSASIYVEKISFAGKSANSIDTTISVEKNINLFSKDALTGIIELPAGSYKDVKVKLFLRKSQRSEMALNLRGTFVNTMGVKDSLMVGSSYPFEVNLGVTDINIDQSNAYNVTFSFDLDKVLTGISTSALQTTRSYVGVDFKPLYIIWKGGSQDEPFYDQVIANWQTVASATIVKK